MIAFVIISLILVVPSLFLLFYAIAYSNKRRRSNKTYGVTVLATIKDVKEEKERLNHDDAVHSKHIEIDCEFVYEGNTYNLVHKIYNDHEIEKYKIGNQIECTYNTKTNELVDNYNLKFKNNIDFYIPIISILLIIPFGIIFEITGSFVLKIIITILGIIFWYSSLYYIFGPTFYKKEKGNYIKLKGHVVDYYVVLGSGDATLHNHYYPEISFKYNNEKKKYVSARGSEKKLYKIGQEIEVLYDPEKDIIYGQSSRTLAIIAYLIPPVCALILLIQYLLK